MKSLNVATLFFCGDKNSENLHEEQRYVKEIISKSHFPIKEKTHIIRTDKDILEINIQGIDVIIIVPLNQKRFSSLFYIAETRLPTFISCREKSLTFGLALDIYEYLSKYPNVELTISKEILQEKLNIIKALNWIKTSKISIFDLQEWKLKEICWRKNPIFLGDFNIEFVEKSLFFKELERIDSDELTKIAEKWSKENIIMEPSIADLRKSARIYLAMKRIMDQLNTKIGYVLWCGQFTKRLNNKMCFSLSKLADKGYLVGCWRGENLLSSLLLHSISDQPVFFCEAYKYNGNILSFRHCFAPSSFSSKKVILKRWRDKENTITGYCEMQRGVVTMINSGQGEKIIIFKGTLKDCKDLGGNNCRMTIWIEIENKDIIQNFIGREFGMIYGDFVKKIKELGEKLGLKIIR